MLVVTGIMAGITVSAMAAQAATTSDVKNTKSGVLSQIAGTQRTAPTTAAVKSSKVSIYIGTAPQTRYLGGYRAWHGDSRYFGRKALDRSCGTGRYSRGVTYTNRYYRPSQARAAIVLRSGGYTRTSPYCRADTRYVSHRCPCCGR